MTILSSQVGLNKWVWLKMKELGLGGFVFVSIYQGTILNTNFATSWAPGTAGRSITQEPIWAETPKLSAVGKQKSGC